MTTFKVRNNILASGGLTIPSGAALTLSGSNNFGTNGTTVNTLMFGTASMICPSANASSVQANTVTIANLPANAVIFMTAASVQTGFALVSASVTAASTISASFLNVTTANISGSSRINFQYLALA